MKRILLLLILVSTATLIQAQRFFYIEPGNMAARIIERDLLKASQFIVKSAVISDYIIKTEVGYQAESNKTTVRLIVEDSVSLKPIYQANEDYLFVAMKANSQLMLNMAMKTLIERNMKEIVYYAKNDR